MNKYAGNFKLTSLFLLSCITALAPSPTPAQTGVSVLTQHNDNSRTGANMGETTLTTSNVNINSFGKLFSIPVDGHVYAQPLYVPSLAIAGGTHNVLFVATAHNTVYALDADNGAQLWTPVNLGPAVPSSVIDTPNIQVEVGIIGTPVIDPATNTLYVAAKTYENSVQIYRLHALDITTGAEKFGGPVVISATAPGNADGGTTVTFNAAKQCTRPGILLLNGTIYVAFASHEDYTPYHGWVLGYDAATLAQTSVYNTTPNGGLGGIWQGGQGLAADASNNIYLMTGNGSYDGVTSFGDSFLKLNSSLAVQDWFTPFNQSTLNAADTDLGSAGPIGIPGTSLIAGGGKQGMLYLVNTANMGHFHSGSDSVVQEFQAATGFFGSPVFWNNAGAPVLYTWGVGDHLKAYAFNGSTFTTTPSSTSTVAIVGGGDPDGALSVSSNGGTAGTGIVWGAIPLADPDHATVNGTLYAFDATNVTNPLWNSRQNAPRDDFGAFAKFCAPTIANGKVYVATDSGQVCVYGLLGSQIPAPPTGVTATAGDTQISLSWSISGAATSYDVLRSTTDGSGYADIAPGLTATNFTDTGLTNGTPYYYVVTATNALGTSGNSAQATATPGVIVGPDPKLTGTLFGSPGSWSGTSSDTFDKAFDGNTSTFFDGPSSSNGNGLYTGVDLGPSVTGTVTSIKYFPRATFAARMLGGAFQGSTDNVTYTNLSTINVTPTDGVWTTVTITGAAPYRYLRYLSPNAGWGNVSEIEFHGTTAAVTTPPAAPAGLAAVAGNAQAALSWSVSSAATSYNVLRSTVNGSAYATVRTGIGTTAYTDTGLTNGRTYYYVVTATNANGTSGNSNQASATPVVPPVNLALNKTATADSTQSGHPTSAANDGNTTTRWTANSSSFPHWWKVDLGASKSLKSSSVMFEASSVWKYKIEVSTNNSTWTKVIDKTANTVAAQTYADTFTATARYVRITVTGAGTGWWASIFEMQVF